MERKMGKQLHDWKNNPERKPLILHGARQVGKTYTALMFGEPENTIRISQKNFGYEDNIKRIPLYAVFCMMEV